ncbi:hypothetical protein RIF29_39236 [Crotalaria pallida]|uniref:Uncharacterized protein n=1 Tax=Crotalaria pallida TaxID=3830 RepID=A0AAN9E1F4_CROPI
MSHRKKKGITHAFAVSHTFSLFPSVSHMPSHASHTCLHSAPSVSLSHMPAISLLHSRLCSLYSRALPSSLSLLRPPPLPPLSPFSQASSSFTISFRRRSCPSASISLPPCSTATCTSRSTPLSRLDLQTGVDLLISAAWMILYMLIIKAFIVNW